MIIVAGEALVDLIAQADGRLVPVAGGGPYNAARAIARLGVPAAWAGGLSSDRFGRMLEAGLAADGVSLELAQRTDRPTTLALAELDEHGAAAYRFYAEGTSAAELYPGPLAGGLPAGTRAVHAGTLGFVLEPMATTLERLVTSLPDDVLLMVDPKPPVDHPGSRRVPGADGSSPRPRRRRQGEHRRPRVPRAGRRAG